MLETRVHLAGSALALVLVLGAGLGAAPTAQRDGALAPPILTGGQRVVLETVSAPPASGGRFPHLAAGADGAVHALWTEVLRAAGADGQSAGGLGHRLRTARFADGSWGEPFTVAEGDGWFVNWADVPRVAVDGERLAATWLERLGSGTYAYGVRAAVSGDGGETWSEGQWLHSDRSATEHGFVSLTALGGGRFGAIWLDGREMAGAEGGEVDGGGHGQGPGAMTLRTGVLEADGSTSAELELDARVCDCCPTALVRMDDGALVAVYRDRSEDEVRDISVVRKGADAASSWSEPRTVHADGWRMPGCPVNGPALAARGSELACAWFTLGEDGKPRVLVARSVDGGASFGAPVQIDGGDPIGRVALAPMGTEGWIVVWLEQSAAGTGQWRARRLDGALSAGPHQVLAEVSTERVTGFPALAPTGDGALFMWTSGDEVGLRAALLREP